MNLKIVVALNLLALAAPTAVYANDSVKNEPDMYIRALSYDPRSLLALNEPGSTESLPGRQKVGNGVIVCTNKVKDLQGALDKIMVLSPGAGVVYPGALIAANKSLAEGKPTPYGIPRAPVKISVDLPGIGDRGVITVEDPTGSNVQSAVHQMVEHWFADKKKQGYEVAGRSMTKVDKVYNSQQISLSLRFGSKWGDNEVTSMMKGSVDNKSSVAVGMFQQTFYTVTMDTPENPASMFPADITVDQLKAARIDNENPPAYIRSVEYGRLIMVRMESSKSHTEGEMEGTLNYVMASGTEVNGETNNTYDNIAKNSTFTVIVVGGSTFATAKSMKFADFKKTFSDVIKKDASFRRDNPGVPIAYSVAFLKDNQMAAYGYTTKYNQSECMEYNNAQIVVHHAGGYVARFSVSWKEKRPDSADVWDTQSWSSGETTATYRKTVTIPGDAKDVHIYADEATGLVWEPWREALNVHENGPTNKCYTIYGTTLNPGSNNSCP